MRTYVGTYTRNCDSEGIYLFELDEGTGKLELKGLAAKADNPSFLTISADNEYIFAVNEIGEFLGEKQGSVSAFRVKGDGLLQMCGKRGTYGSAPCHIAATSNRAFIGVANYMGGNVALCPFTADGKLDDISCVVSHEGSGPNMDRQEQAHAHSFNIAPNDRDVYVCDLGMDKIMIYRLEPSGMLVSGDPAFVEAAPGAGPRHMAWHPTKPWAYVINELNCTLTAYAVDADNGNLHELSTVPTLPSGLEGDSICADVHVSPDGRFIYGSNRGDNSIVVCAINADTGELTVVQHVSSGGDHPRNFAITPSGKFLLVANQNANEIVTLAIDPNSGKLSGSMHVAEVPMPVCIKFMDSNEDG